MSFKPAFLVASVSLWPLAANAATSEALAQPVSTGTGDPFTVVIGHETTALRNIVSTFREDPLQWGPFRLRPHVDYGFTYATGVLRGRGHTEDTAEHSISPGLTLQTPHVTLDYTPELSYYTKGSYEDTVNHNASLRAGFGLGDWQFGLSHGYSRGSRGLIETAQQTDYQRHSTGFSASWLYSDKTSFDFSLSQSLNDTSEFQSSKTWSTMNWANYHFSEKLLIGAGVGGGYSDVERGSDMTYEQIQARIGWYPGPKLSLDLNGGVEIRQFLGITGASDLVNPIMGASASYQLFETTSFSLHANRSVGASLFSDQITETTSFSAAVRQRFFGRLNGTLSGGFRMSDYQSSSRQFSVNRSDDVTFFSASLGTQIFKKGNISIFYTRSENDSTLEGYSYASNQYGLQFGYRF